MVLGLLGGVWRWRPNHGGRLLNLDGAWATDIAVRIFVRESVPLAIATTLCEAMFTAMGNANMQKVQAPVCGSNLQETKGQNV